MVFFRHPNEAGVLAFPRATRDAGSNVTSGTAAPDNGSVLLWQKHRTGGLRAGAKRQLSKEEPMTSRFSPRRRSYRWATTLGAKPALSKKAFRPAAVSGNARHSHVTPPALIYYACTRPWGRARVVRAREVLFAALRGFLLGARTIELPPRKSFSSWAHGGASVVFAEGLFRERLLTISRRRPGRSLFRPPPLTGAIRMRSGFSPEFCKRRNGERVVRGSVFLIGKLGVSFLGCRRRDVFCSSSRLLLLYGGVLLL